jgi:RNase adapter protein RapZ
LRIVVLTGMSGAGRTAALRVFEDLGYFGVDNLPPALLPELADRCRAQENIDQVAVVIDLRAGFFFADLPQALDTLRTKGYEVEILYLDATDEALIRRFKETRRKHPLFTQAGSVAESIEMERSVLAPVREASDRVIDTSLLAPRDLYADLRIHYATAERPGGLQITVVSFGFKHGIPIDADLVFDLRFLRNPHYVDALRTKSGRDAEVAAYIDEDPNTGMFLQKLKDLLAFAVPCYVEEGKAYLTIGIGCTGGQHRSVCFGERISAFLLEQGFSAVLRHRDITLAA